MIKLYVQYGTSIMVVEVSAYSLIGHLYREILNKTGLEANKVVNINYSYGTLGSAPYEFSKTLVNAGIETSGILFIILNHYPDLTLIHGHSINTIYQQWLISHRSQNISMSSYTYDPIDSNLYNEPLSVPSGSGSGSNGNRSSLSNSDGNSSSVSSSIVNSSPVSSSSISARPSYSSRLSIPSRPLSNQYSPRYSALVVPPLSTASVSSLTVPTSRVLPISTSLSSSRLNIPRNLPISSPLSTTESIVSRPLAPINSVISGLGSSNSLNLPSVPSNLDQVASNPIVNLGNFLSHAPFDTYIPANLIDVPVVMSRNDVDRLPQHSYPDMVNIYQARFSGQEAYNRCPITRELFTDQSRVIALACGHYFSESGIRPWLTEQNVRCPVCNTDIRSTLSQSQSALDQVDSRISQLSIELSSLETNPTRLQEITNELLQIRREFAHDDEDSEDIYE